MTTTTLLERLEVRTGDHREGLYYFTDVRDDETWGDVAVVETHRTFTWKLLGVTNHRSYDEAVKKYNMLKKIAQN